MYHVSMLYAIHFPAAYPHIINWLEYDGECRSNKNKTCVAKKTNIAGYRVNSGKQSYNNDHVNNKSIKLKMGMESSPIISKKHQQHHV